MKKFVWLWPLGIFYFLVSCSSPQGIVLTSQEDTLRNELQGKTENTYWTDEIEAERLTAKYNQNINTDSREFITPQMLSSIKELQPVVYPQIKDFASLDCSSMNTSLFSHMDQFCKELCKGTDNLSSFFNSKHFFNYVFFKNDFEEIAKEIKGKDPSLEHEHKQDVIVYLRLFGGLHIGLRALAEPGAKRFRIAVVAAIQHFFDIATLGHAKLLRPAAGDGVDIFRAGIDGCKHFVRSRIAEDTTEVAGGVLDSAIDCERADGDFTVEHGFGFIGHWKFLSVFGYSSGSSYHLLSVASAKPSFDAASSICQFTSEFQFGF